MKAIRVREFGPPEVMRLEEVPDPLAGPGQVLLRIKAAGVNPLDTYVRSGTYAKKPTLPFTPGFDAAGVVEAVGEGVTGVAAGDRVYVGGTVSGTYAERALAEASRVHPLPENISFAQGAAVHIPYASAYRALHQLAHAVPGETVLVHGASGGVGIAAVQVGAAGGMKVIATAGSARGRELVAREGSHYTLDHARPGYLDEVMEITGGRGVDVIVEMLANVNLGKDLKVLAPGGRVVVVGSRGPVEIDPRDTMLREASILGLYLFNASASDSAAIHAALYAGFQIGTLRPVVREELPLAEAARAHREVMEPGAHGKIVLIP